MKAVQGIFILGLAGILGAGVAMSDECGMPKCEKGCHGGEKMQDSCERRERPPHPTGPFPPFFCGMDLNKTQKAELEKIDEAHHASMKKLHKEHMQQIALILDAGQKKLFEQNVKAFEKHREMHKPPLMK